MILNSVISFTSKCLDEGLKTKDLVDLLLGHYDRKALIESVDLARSLLKKEERPKGIKANYRSVAPLEPREICRLLISMVKVLKKSPYFVFASYGLNVPIAYASEKCQQC